MVKHHVSIGESPFFVALSQESGILPSFGRYSLHLPIEGWPG